MLTFVYLWGAGVPSSAALELLRKIVGDRDEQPVKVPALNKSLVADVRQSEIEAIMPEDPIDQATEALLPVRPPYVKRATPPRVCAHGRMRH